MSEKTTVTQDEIYELVSKAEIKAHTMFGKTTVVAVQLENGFVLVESSSCVDPKNYDEVVGYEICMNRIMNKLWEMEGYLLQKKVFEDDKAEKISVSNPVC